MQIHENLSALHVNQKMAIKKFARLIKTWQNTIHVLPLKWIYILCLSQQEVIVFMSVNSHSDNHSSSPEIFNYKHIYFWGMFRQCRVFINPDFKQLVCFSLCALSRWVGVNCGTQVSWMHNPAQKPTANSGNVAYDNSGRRFACIYLFTITTITFSYWKMLELVVVKSLLK